MENIGKLAEEPSKSRVYIDFYQLKESPFSITPDPEFLFFSQTHQSVMERVLYSIGIRMGFILLSGEVGTGKTTICRSIIDALETKADTVYIINPSLSGKALIASILDDLSVPYAADASKKDLIDQLNNFLLNRDCHKPVVIIIDDAQTMPLEVLEDLRLLSNLETDKEKMLQMVIVGQPEIADTLARPDMRQLRQRITVNCRLEQLNPREVDNYIDRRLFIAGSNGQVQFSRGAKRIIANISKGIPRAINKICDYALTAGYVSDEYVISKKHVKRAISELGDWGPESKIFHKAQYLSGIWAPRLLLAAALSMAVTLPLFLISQSEQLKAFPDYIARLLLGGQNFLSDQADFPQNKPLTSGEVASKQTNQLGKPIAHFFSAPKKDNYSQAAAVDQNQENQRGPQWIPSYHPFVIQLGSFKNFKQVTRAVASYASKGLDVHWDWVDLGEKGKWYRVFIGYFESKADALKAQRVHGLKNSLIRFNPWTVLVGRFSEGQTMISILSRLRENHFDTHIVESADDFNWLLTGAFANRQGAEKVVNELQMLNLSAQVVPR